MPRSETPRRTPRSFRLQVERLDDRLVLSASGPLRAATVLPADPGFRSQWGLNSASDVDVNAPEAWGVTTGSSSVIVAILDSGIDAKNPEFRGRLWVNPAASRPGRPVYGWNFVAGHGDVTDDYGHGTHVAGTIGASANDRRGIVGVDWNARLMILKTLDAQGNGSMANAAAALRFAVDNGARVVNASWATTEYSQELYDAASYANERGVVIVAAAGNESADDDARSVYPAAFNLPNILVVAAVDAAGNLAGFSNFGATTVDVAAPGVDVYGTYGSRAQYATLSGTSMAAPFATGVVSLLVGLHPDWSAEQLVQQVRATARPLPSLAGRTVAGMVDAGRAVGALENAASAEPSAAAAGSTPSRISARSVRSPRPRPIPSTAPLRRPPALPVRPAAGLRSISLS